MRLGHREENVKMKKSLFRSLIIGLIFSVMLLFLAACGDTDSDDEYVDSGDAETADTDYGDEDDGDEDNDDADGDEEDTDDGEETAYVDAGGLDGTLRILSFMDDPHVLGTYFTYYHPGIEIDFMMTGMADGAYQEQLQMILAGGTDVPDIVMLDAQFVRQFVESPFLSDLSDMRSVLEGLEIYNFTIDAGTDDDGVLRAISHQAAPGVMYYRRSLAEEYFGTDDPEVIQTYFADMDTMLESAMQIREASGGDTYTIASHVELSNLFFANMATPWIVDDQLMIDPILHQYLDIAREFRENGLEAEVSTWSGEWFSGMSDTMVDAHGDEKQIFAYFLPTWGLNHILMGSAASDETDTSGDWGVIPGPLPYQWGGAWFAIPNDAQNPEAAAEFLNFVFTEDLLTKWATGYLTNERMREIDSSFPDDLSIPAGDFVSSDLVVQAVAPQIVGTDTYDFVGGQNPHDVFAQVSPYIDLSNIQASDFIMNAAWTSAVTQYIEGQLDREDAIQSFIDSVLIDLPHLSVPD